MHLILVLYYELALREVERLFTFCSGTTNESISWVQITSYVTYASPTVYVLRVHTPREIQSLSLRSQLDT